MFIRKQPPKPHAPGEPLLFDNHPRPVTRRDFIAAGMMTGPAMVVGPAWLGTLLKSGRAEAALDPDLVQLLAQNQCNVPTGASSGVAFICFDLAGGANLVGSEVVVGVKGGQTNFLSTAGYEKLGVPGNMVPSSSANIDASMGLLFQTDSAIKRGIGTKATAPTLAFTDGGVFCASSQNDTQTNPHNPMYGIARAAQPGQLMTLIGTESSVSGGNSMAPPLLIDPSLQPTTISRPADATALVPIPPGGKQDPLSVAVLQSQARISGGSTPQSGAGDTAAFTGALATPGGSTPGVQLYTDPTSDAALKNQVRCSYVKAANTADVFGSPAALDPTQDPDIVGPIFQASDFNDSDVRKTATVMKMVIDGYASAGTITMGGYDYHDGTRASGEGKNFKAGQMIGAVLEYARRRNKPVMVYVLSDGSLSSNMMVDNSTGGRGKLGWQGDNSDCASTFFLVYSPKGRPALRNGAAGRQIGWFSSDGSVVTSASPVGNSVTTLVQAVILNYMGLLGTTGSYANLFKDPSMQLGSAAQMDALTVFEPI